MKPAAISAKISQ